VFIARSATHPALAGVVTAAWYFEGTFAHRHERLLPSGEPQLLINLAADELRWYPKARASSRRLSGTVVAGPYAKPFFIDTFDQRSIIGVSFEPGAASAVLGVPLVELQNTHEDLASVWGESAHELRERALAAPDRVAALDAVLGVLARRRMERAHPFAPLQTMRHIAHELGAGQPVTKLATKMGWTHGRLLTTARAGVGLTPKMYARLGRFQRALRCACLPSGPNWAQVAAQTGYFDQAHLHRDFRAFYGKAPGSYRPRAAGDVNHVVATENFSKTTPSSST